MFLQKQLQLVTKVSESQQRIVLNPTNGEVRVSEKYREGKGRRERERERERERDLI